MEKLSKPSQVICGKRFIVNRADHLSINDLLELQKTDSVTRTPHVGNLYSGSLLWTAMGGRSIFYDNTTGKKDKNFHPNLMIFNGRPVQIAPEDTLVRNTKTYDNRNLSDVHMTAINKRFPEAGAITYQEYQKLNNDLVVGILESLTKNGAHIPLDRFANNSGEIFEKSTTYNRQTPILGLNNSTSGYILPNVMNVFLSGVVESVLFEKQDVYHLSGPDMILYIKELGETLDEWYSVLKDAPEFTNILPANLNFNLVPAASAKLIVPQAFATDLDELVAGQSERDAIKQSYGQRIKQANNSTERQELIAQRKIIEVELYKNIGEKALKLGGVFFGDYRSPNRELPSQYTQGELYIHKSSLELSAKHTIDLIKTLNTSYEYAKEQNEI